MILSAGQGLGVWLTKADLIRVAKISPGAAISALRRGHAQEPWRGHRILVRRVPTRKKGQERYEVLLSSLPSHLQERWFALQREERGEVAGGVDQVDADVDAGEELCGEAS